MIPPKRAVSHPARLLLSQTVSPKRGMTPSGSMDVTCRSALLLRAWPSISRLRMMAGGYDMEEAQLLLETSPDTDHLQRSRIGSRPRFDSEVKADSHQTANGVLDDGSVCG